MDKTNKITITCSDWPTRVEVSQALADTLHVNFLDVDDYIIRGSVLNGDIEEYSKDCFITTYGQELFNTLEGLSYLAYVETVKEPFVIAIGNDKNDKNLSLLEKTISINLKVDDKQDLSSRLMDYTIKKSKSVASTAKEIAKIVTSDERWDRNL